jgi:hypothetical protein
MANALIASPVASRQYVKALNAALDRAVSIDELITRLYEEGASHGQHGAPEAAGLLWSLADAIKDSLAEAEEADRG